MAPGHRGRISSVMGKGKRIVKLRLLSHLHAREQPKAGTAQHASAHRRWRMHGSDVD